MNLLFLGRSEDAHGHLVPFDVGHTVRWKDNIHDVIDESVFEDSVRDRGGAEAGTGIDLNEPGLEVVVDDDVISVALVAVSI